MFGKNIGKWLAVFLAFACALTTVPRTVFADELILTEPEVISDESIAGGDEMLMPDAEVIEGNDAAALEADDLEADRETEDVLRNAKNVTIDTKETGKATSTQKAYFKFTPEKTGRYELTGTSDDDMTVRVFDGDKYVESRTDGCYYWHRQYTKTLDNTGAQGNRVDLIGGKTCYIVIENASSSSEINFDFTIRLLYEVTLYEKDSPVPVAFNKEYSGHFAPDEFMNTDNHKYEYTKNCYKFHMDRAGSFTFHIGDDSTKREYPYKTFTTYRICNDLDDIGATDPNKNNMSWNWKTNFQEDYGSATSHNTWFNAGNESDEGRISLLAGDYYIVIEGNMGTGYDKSLTYKFILKDLKYLDKKAGEEAPLIDTRLNGSNDNRDFRQTGNGQYYEKEPMPQIYANKIYRGILTEDSRVDYYHLRLEKDGPLFLTLESDEGIGKCQFKMEYWSEKYETYSDLLDKTYFSTPDIWLSSEQMQNHYDETNAYIAKNKPIFKAGDYVIQILPQRENDDSKKIYLGTSGQYRFMISTGAVSSKPVSSLKLDNKNNVIALCKDETAILTATVGPKTASDTSVNFSVEPAGIIEVTQKEFNAGETKLEIKAIAESGDAKITVKTNAAGPQKSPLEVSCMVSVISSSVCDQPIAVREKIDLGGETYFNTSEITSADKFDIIPEDPKNKGVGSVSKGIFTAKKSGRVSLIWKKKVGKEYIPQKKITIDLKMPEYKKNDKNKDIKVSDIIVKRNTIISPADWLLDLDKYETIKPTSFECDAASLKKGLAVIDEEGNVTVLKSGNIKVTALYGKGKNASKMVYTIKAKVPFIKDIKAKPNAVKANAKDKTVTFSVSNLPNTVTLTADDWKIRKAVLDEKGNVTGYTDEEPDPDKIRFTAGVKGNYSKAAVDIAPGTEAQTVAVIVTVDSVEYPGYLTIQ